MIENEIRGRFLGSALKVIELIELQLDDQYGKSMSSEQTQIVNLIWPLVTDIIKDSKRITPLNLKDKDTNQKLEELFKHIADGSINFDDAKQYMSLISQGFEMSDMIELNARLERMENM